MSSTCRSRPRVGRALVPARARGPSRILGAPCRPSSSSRRYRSHKSERSNTRTPTRTAPASCMTSYARVLSSGSVLMTCATVMYARPVTPTASSRPRVRLGPLPADDVRLLVLVVCEVARSRYRARCRPRRRSGHEPCHGLALFACTRSRPAAQLAGFVRSGHAPEPALARELARFLIQVC